MGEGEREGKGKGEGEGRGWLWAGHMTARFIDRYIIVLSAKQSSLSSHNRAGHLFLTLCFPTL